MLTIQGYLCHFNDRACIDRQQLKFERFQRNSIISKRAPLRIDHSRLAGNYGWARLGQDAHGYRFSASIADDRHGYAVARMIKEGCNNVSMSFRALACRNDGTTTVIEHARLLEVSLVLEGAYESARCWVADADLEDAPRDIQALVQKWNAEEQVSTLTAQEMLATVNASIVVPPDNRESFVYIINDLNPVHRYMSTYLNRCPSLNTTTSRA